MRWRDSQGRGCQDYNNDTNWCDDLIDNNIVRCPPKIYEKPLDPTDATDAYYQITFSTSDVCCAWKQSNRGVGEVSVPLFLCKNITKSTPYPNSQNIISITLKSNVNIPAQSVGSSSCSPFGAEAHLEEKEDAFILNTPRPILAGQVNIVKFMLHNPARNVTFFSSARTERGTCLRRSYQPFKS